jgi:nitrile hydratase subunit beta
MNGIHDLGGMHGFGPVEREADEPPFHAPWEATMVAIQDAVCNTVINIDQFRHGIERMAPAEYLETSYYEHWLDGIARVLVEEGIVSAEELDRRSAYFQAHRDAGANAAFAGTPSAPAPRRHGGVIRSGATPPAFAPGDRVVTRVSSPPGHTRLPRYARGKRGVVERVHGTHVFPDSNAHGQGERPQPVYGVRFDARELWGDSAEPNGSVSLDLWESYLRSDED